MSEHLRRNVDSEKVLFHEDYPEDGNLRKVISKRREKIEFIIGHEYSYGIHKLFPGREARYVTFIRNPAERIISRYNYDVSFIEGKDTISFEKWYASQIKNEMTLFFDRKLKGLRASRVSYPEFLKPLLKKIIFRRTRLKTLLLRTIAKKFSRTDKNSLIKAKSFLDKCYFVAITEKLDRDLKFLCGEIGIFKNIKKENVTRKLSNRKQLKLTPALRGKIYKDNGLDFELYEYALGLNECFG